jgi:hypothetical protein
VGLNTPLNARQVEVLRWISDGCPDGAWTNFTFKTTATALASRRLVIVSKRGGVWSAALLPAGEHYLANDRYPAGHWNNRRGQPAESDEPVRSPAIAQRPVISPEPGAAERRANEEAQPVGLTPTRKLLKAIIDAGGILEIDTKDDDTSYRSLVGILNRRGMAPDGQEVIMLRGKSYHHTIFRLSSVSDWQTESAADIVAADRIGRWHPAVATLRSEKRLDSIEKELRGRAFRLLHALAREAAARGHSVRLPRRNHHGYVEDASKLSGDLIFKVGEIECSVDIRQPKDRVEHTPTQEEIARDRKYDWPPRRYDYVPSNRLSIVIDTNSRFSSKESWTETKSLPLHRRLPDVLITFERWAVIDAEGKDAERRADIERRDREAREEEVARQAYIQHALGEHLVADAKDWERTKRLQLYIAEMATRIDGMTDDADRDAAAEWLRWCEEYTASRDPFSKPIRRPQVKTPGFSQLQDFRRRLGFAMPY